VIIEDFKASVIGKCSIELPEDAIRFAIHYFLSQEKPNLYATDVASCIELARQFTRCRNPEEQAHGLIAKLEEFRHMLEDAMKIKKTLDLMVSHTREMARTEKRIADLEAYLLRSKLKAEQEALKKPRLKSICKPNVKSKQEVMLKKRTGLYEQGGEAVERCGAGIGVGSGENAAGAV